MRKIFPEKEGSDGVIVDNGQFIALENQIKAINDKNAEQDNTIDSLENKTSYTGLTEVSSDTVNAGNLNTDFINNSDTITSDKISSNSIETESLESDEISADELSVDNATISNLTVNNVSIMGGQTFEDVDIADAGISNAVINNAEINVADVDTLSSDNASIDNLTVNTSATLQSATIGNLTSTDATIDDLIVNNSIEADSIKSDEADINSAVIDSLMNMEIVHSEYYMILDEIQDNNDFYWVRIPSFKSGTYTITIVGTEDSIGEVPVGEESLVDVPLLSLTVTNSFDNISFKYSKYKISIMDDVLIKDDMLYLKIHDNGKIYYSWNVLTSVNNPATYLNYCPIDPDEADYSITLNQKYGDIYTHYVLAQNLSEGGGGTVVGWQPLTVSPTNDIANAIPTGDSIVEYNGEDAEAVSIYVPDQNLNKSSDVNFHNVVANDVTVIDNDLTVRHTRTTPVVGVSGVTVKNFDGNNTDKTFGIDSNGDFFVGTHKISDDTYVERQQILSGATGLTKVYVEKKTPNGSMVDQIIAETDANANTSVALRGSDGSLKALMPSTVDNTNVINKAYLESQKGSANGIAPLDNNGRIPVDYLPESSIVFRGGWDASQGYPETQDPTYTPETGDYWLCTTAGTIDGVVFYVNDGILWNGSSWTRKADTDAVSSVNGKIGAVVLDKTDIGLENVENKDGQTIAEENVTNLGLELDGNDDLTVSLDVGSETLSASVPKTDIFNGFQRFEEMNDGSFEIEIDDTTKSLDSIVNTDIQDQTVARKDFTGGIKIDGVLITVV